VEPAGAAGAGGGVVAVAAGVLAAGGGVAESGGDHGAAHVQRLPRGGELGRDGGDATARDADVARGVEPRLGVEHASAREHEIVRLGAGCAPRREARQRGEQGGECAGRGQTTARHGRVLTGWSASCTASPSSVHATTTSTSATPGAVATQGALTSVSRPEAIMLPHDGVGGCTPRPRNERPASSMIALPTPSAAATMTGVSAL